MCSCVCLHVHIYVCMRVHMYVAANGQPGCHSSEATHLGLSKGLSLPWNSPSRLGWLPEVLNGSHHVWLFFFFQTQVLILVKWAQKHFPSPTSLALEDTLKNGTSAATWTQDAPGCQQIQPEGWGSHYCFMNQCFSPWRRSWGTTAIRTALGSEESVSLSEANDWRCLPSGLLVTCHSLTPQSHCPYFSLPIG